MPAPRFSHKLLDSGLHPHTLSSVRSTVILFSLHLGVTSDLFPLDFHCGQLSGHSTLCPLIDMAKLMGVFWRHLVAIVSELSRSFFYNFSLPLFTSILISTSVSLVSLCK